MRVLYKKINIIRGTRTSTGNYHTHYARVHPDISAGVRDYCNENEDKTREIRKLKVQTVLPLLIKTNICARYSSNTNVKCARKNSAANNM